MTPSRSRAAKRAGSRAPAGTPETARAPRRADAGPVPPLWRDPWALATALAVIPLLVRCAGAPLGEAVAEDFDFLHRSLFVGLGSLLDGGGSSAFWRPLAHQVYYAALGPLIVSHPLVVAMLHALLLLAGSLLVYRALRPHLGGTVACVAATFPMLSESTRTLVSWPSQFVDVGLYFFTAVSLHETARRRLPSALAATLFALLCKELAVIPALLLPWFPDGRPRAERRRWAIAFGVLLAAWAGAYLAVRSAAGLHLPHGLEQDANLLSTPLLMRMSWAVGGTLRALVSLPLAPVAEDAVAIPLALGLLLVVLGRLATSLDVRARLRERRGWIMWGGAWFAAGALALAPIFPLWQPNRAHFASTGAGVAAAAALEAAHPMLAGALVLGRGVLLILSPGAPPRVTRAAPQHGAFMDFERLARLQRLMVEARTTLKREFPKLPPHAGVAMLHPPFQADYAAGDRALQVWYADSTLRWLRWERMAAAEARGLAGAMEFQEDTEPQFRRIEPEALRLLFDAGAMQQREEWAASVDALQRADSLQRDRLAHHFLGRVEGLKAWGLGGLGRLAEAESSARHSLVIAPENADGHLTLAALHNGRGEYAQALAHLDTLQTWYPNYQAGLMMRQGVMERMRAAATPATPNVMR